MADATESPSPSSGNADRDLAAKWLSEIETAERIGQIAKWHKQGDQVIRRYKDERDNQRDGLTFRRMRMNLLWSNVQTLSPALYARTPKPDVQRRNKDKDRVALWAGIVLQRCLAYVLGYQDFDHTMRLTVGDYLLPGRGTTWEVYEPQITTDAEGERLEWENSKTKYIHWKDFLTNPARTWEEVWWAGHRAYQSRKELLKLLLSLGVEEAKARKIAAGIRLTHQPPEETKKGGDENKKAVVWCLWDKNERQVVYVSPGWTEGTLATSKPPLKFDNFFPCPRPLTATTASDSIIPVPDFAMYQDQADEIDELTQRIYLLTRALKVVGVYNSANPAIGSLLNDGTDNTMIPVDTWAMFAQTGGLEGNVDFFPIEMVAKTLEWCTNAREVCKQNMYEITGISDIVRGASDANETATAQQIKSQWGSLRIRDRQAEVQRFARDIIRLKAEVICETFSPDTIKRMSGVKLLDKAAKSKIEQQMAAMQQQAQAAQQMGQQPPQPPQIPDDMKQLMSEPTWEEVLGLLKAEHIRGFAIDIEADSTIQPDEQAEQEGRTQFLTAVGGFLTQAAPLAEQMPAIMPLLSELLMFGIRGWKVGETIETTIEESMQQMQQQLSQPKPDPQAEAEKMKVQAQQQADQQKLQFEREKHQQEMAFEREKHQMEMQADAAKAQQDVALREREMQMGMQQKQQELEGNMLFQREKLDGDRQMAREQHADSMAFEREKHGADVALQGEKMAADYDVAMSQQQVDADVQREGIAAKAAAGEGKPAAQGAAMKGPLTQLAAALTQQGEDFKAGMTALAQAVMAETELVRDPTTQRAVGTRRKQQAVN